MSFRVDSGWNLDKVCRESREMTSPWRAIFLHSFPGRASQPTSQGNAEMHMQNKSRYQCISCPLETSHQGPAVIVVSIGGTSCNDTAPRLLLLLIRRKHLHVHK